MQRRTQPDAGDLMGKDQWSAAGVRHAVEHHVLVGRLLASQAIAHGVLLVLCNLQLQDQTLVIRYDIWREPDRAPHRNVRRSYVVGGLPQHAAILGTDE